MRTLKYHRLVKVIHVLWIKSINTTIYLHVPSKINPLTYTVETDRYTTCPIAAIKFWIFIVTTRKIEHSVLSVVVMVTDYPLDGLVLRTRESERLVIVIDPWMHAHQQVKDNWNWRIILTILSVLQQNCYIQKYKECNSEYEISKFYFINTNQNTCR